jgi:hypothetical protein
VKKLVFKPIIMAQGFAEVPLEALMKYSGRLIQLVAPWISTTLTVGIAAWL